jgi:hypothetical protein
MVGKNGAKPENSIERFISLSNHADQRPEGDDIFGCVCEKMEFDFGKNFGRVDDGKHVHNVASCDMKVGLKEINEQVIKAMDASNSPDIRRGFESQEPR